MMGEVIRITPIVEIRETFIPSERFRDALADNLLDPELDKKIAESLRATLLFKSFRRRVYERSNYILNERDSDGRVRAASLGFRALAAEALGFSGKIRVVSMGDEKRFIFSVLTGGKLDKVSNILDSIPTIEDVDPANTGRELVYVDIASRNITNGYLGITEGIYNIHNKIVHPTQSRQYYVNPDKIITNETILRTKFTIDDDLEMSDI